MTRRHAASHEIQVPSPLFEAADVDTFARREANLGLHMLFFVCIPPQPQGLDMLGILQQLPHEYLQGKSVQHALEVHRALTCGDWQQYSRLFAVGSWQQRCLMHHRLDQDSSWACRAWVDHTGVWSCQLQGGSWALSISHT